MAYYALELRTTKNFDRSLDAILSYCDGHGGVPRYTVLEFDRARSRVTLRVERGYGDWAYIVGDLATQGGGYGNRYVRGAIVEHVGGPAGCDCTPCMEGGLDVLFHDFGGVHSR